MRGKGGSLIQRGVDSDGHGERMAWDLGGAGTPSPLATHDGYSRSKWTV